MHNKLIPSLIINRIDELDLDGLLKKGITGLVIDIDNTLTRHDQLNCETWALNFVEKLKQKGFKICLVSNNNLERVKPICSQLKLPAVHDAGKPSKHAYEKALEILKVSPKNAAAIGDQIYTDVLGGNRAGLFTVLTYPIDPREVMKIKIFRPLEKILRLFFRLNT